MRSPLSSAALSLAALLGLSAAAQNAAKPTLTVTAITTKTVIPGLENVQLPPEALAALGGAAGQRSLSVQLARPGAAPPAQPVADLDIPAGLKLGPTLKLEVPQAGTSAGQRDLDQARASLEAFEIRQYWGCSATVKPGQPRVVKGKEHFGLGAARSPAAAAAADAKVTDTYAYWPNAKQKTPPVTADAVLPGKYTLKSNFVNEVRFEVPAGVNFLAPVSLSAGEAPDLGEAVKLSWKPVPGALGYLATATTAKGDRTMIMWTSAEDGTHPAAWAGGSSGEMAELVRKGIVMKADRAECTIPAGIFEGCAGVSVSIRAFGPSFEENTTTPAVRVDTQAMSSLVITGE